MMASPYPVAETPALRNRRSSHSRSVGSRRCGREFAAGAAGGRCGEECAASIDRDSADRALFVAAMICSGVFVFLALLPGLPFGFGDEFFGIAERDALGFGVTLGAFPNQHHVRAGLQDFACEFDGIADAL